LWLPSLFAAGEPDTVSLARQLHDEKRWEELARLARESPDAPAEVDYLGGLALARLERWGEARQVFERGRRKAPRDKRFSIELAGVAFKQKKPSEAKKALRRALSLDATDAYANDFLATLYLLEDNLEAALKYWNRAGKPEIEEVRAEPEPAVDAVLLDRAFAFAPAEVLRLEDFRRTKARLDLLGVFRRYRFDLEPAREEKFDVVFRSAERAEGDNRLAGTLLPALRGLPYQTVYLDVANLGQKARNFESLLRWDAQKRRAFAAFSAPLAGEAAWRYRLHADLRNENWDLREAFAGSGAPVGALNLRRSEAGIEIESRPVARWGWSSAALASHRSFRHSGFDEPWAREFLAGGFGLKARARVDYDLLRVPEHRFTTRAAARWQAGKVFREGRGPYSTLEGSLAARWLPRARGDDFETTARFRAGRTFGRVPFDELFQLGVERDNELWLRGHRGTRDGRKGSAPLGRNYLLADTSFEKTLFAGPVVSLGAGPFLDVGRIYDSSDALGSKKWLWDTGAQLRVRVMGSFEAVFIYGKDLRLGRNVFYATAMR
jgi:hypothetical protein